MSKRLQVLLDEAEFEEIRAFARRHRMTVAEWVRQALRAAARTSPRGDTQKKLAIVRAASQYAFPTAEIDRMLGEIERGFIGSTDDLR